MADQEKGLDISWKHTKNRRQITIVNGDARISISHTKDMKGASEMGFLVNVLPSVLQFITAKINEQENPEDDIER